MLGHQAKINYSPAGTSATTERRREPADATRALSRTTIERALSRRGRRPCGGKGGDTEWIYWGSGTPRLLPHLLRGRDSGPVFLSQRRPAPVRRPGM